MSDEMQEMNTELFSKLDESMLYVIDFSAIVNIKSQETLNILISYILDSKSKVAVSREFYENYGVVVQSRNDEQKNIAKSSYNFLNILKNNGCLLNIPDTVDSKKIIMQLCRNPKVCFVYFKHSEFSENIIENRLYLKSKAIVINENGEYCVCYTSDEIVNASLVEIDDTVIDDNFFHISSIPTSGEFVKTRNNEMLRLGKILGSGGEGSVYECDSVSDYVVKIYHDKQLNKLRLKKLFLMEKKQVKYDGICWPEKVVFSEKGEPVGYIMKKIHGNPLSTIFDCDETVLKKFPYWKKQNLILLAINILQKVQYLHLLGILIGDLRLKNIVINDNGEPCIVDIDSCQIDNLPCPIGFPDFTPPELQHVEFKKQLRTYKNESFSCSVLVFKLLFCGLHPYDQKNGAETIEEEICSQSFPYPNSIDGDFTRIPWGGYDQMWKNTPFQLQTFFYSIFKNGNRYGVQEMILMLDTYNKFLDMKKKKYPSLNEISFFIE